MPLILGTDTVLEYLITRNLCTNADLRGATIEPKIFKNFNLLVHLAGDRSLLVKQEPHDQAGNTRRDLEHEWQLYRGMRSHVDLAKLQSLLSVAIDADAENAILVFHYLNNYSDLDQFYEHNQIFPDAVAKALGTALATVHRATFHHGTFQTTLSKLDDDPLDQPPDLSHGLARITPEIFGNVATDGLKFYELYQRYDSLGGAIAALNKAFTPCCLTHNDLKFTNILLHTDWDGLSSHLQAGVPQPAIRFIDWEKWIWGDPASDVGMIIADFLKIWLKSLVVSPDLDMQTSLRSATTPLETLQSSMIAFLRAYFTQFPALVNARPDVLTRIMQFAGLALIESIRARLYYLEPFGNRGICLLQVAKTLLSTPEASIPAVLGLSASELVSPLLPV